MTGTIWFGLVTVAMVTEYLKSLKVAEARRTPIAKYRTNITSDSYIR